MELEGIFTTISFNLLCHRHLPAQAARAPSSPSFWAWEHSGPHCSVKNSFLFSDISSKSFLLWFKAVTPSPITTHTDKESPHLYCRLLLSTVSDLLLCLNGISLLVDAAYLPSHEELCSFCPQEVSDRAVCCCYFSVVCLCKVTGYPCLLSLIYPHFLMF